jgi:hypothetical protein
LQLKNFETRVDSVAVDEEVDQPEEFNEHIKVKLLEGGFLVGIFIFDWLVVEAVLEYDGDWHP